MYYHHLPELLQGQCAIPAGVEDSAGGFDGYASVVSPMSQERHNLLENGPGEAFLLSLPPRLIFSTELKTSLLYAWAGGLEVGARRVPSANHIASCVTHDPVTLFSLLVLRSAPRTLEEPYRECGKFAMFSADLRWKSRRISNLPSKTIPLSRSLTGDLGFEPIIPSNDSA